MEQEIINSNVQYAFVFDGKNPKDKPENSKAYYYDKERPVDFSIWKTKTLLEPHSQYWLIAAEFGLLGIAALSYFFFSLLQASWRLHKMKFMACAMLVPFAIGNLSDSLLFYSGSGYFFILFMAMFLGEEFEYNKRDVADGQIATAYV